MVVAALWLTAVPVFAQTGGVSGIVRDETGGALPGVAVELRGKADTPRVTTADSHGAYRFEQVAPGTYQLSFTLINFAAARRTVVVASTPVRIDAVLQLAVNADVTVTGKRTFANLADVQNPAENLVGIAQSGEPGCDHREAARRTAADARRRGARNRPRRDRHAAQRRGQGQPVLPARLQPRSRHRLRDDGRRHAGESADARAWTGLFRPQFPDSRARQRRAVFEGTVLRGAGRLRDRRIVEHQLRKRARPRRSFASRGARTATPVRWSRPRRPSAAVISSARSKSRTTTVRGIDPTTTAR